MVSVSRSARGDRRRITDGGYPRVSFWPWRARRCWPRHCDVLWRLSLLFGFGIRQRGSSGSLMSGVTRLFAGDGIGNPFDQPLSRLVVEVFVGPFWKMSTSATGTPVKCLLLTWNAFLDELLPKLHCSVLEPAFCWKKSWCCVLVKIDKVVSSRRISNSSVLYFPWPLQVRSSVPT